jgi:sigma-B regulation protein RsbU (phosphoserine phosphatase)
MSKLRITDHQGKPSTLDLQAGARIRIGRSEQNELVLTDPSLSRNHAEVWDEQGKWMLKDCGSRNGTLVNGRPIEAPVLLETGLQVTLGASRFSLETDASQAPSASVIFHDRPLEATGTMVLSPDELIQPPKAAAADPLAFKKELEKIQKRLAIVEKANLELLAHESADVLLPKVLDLVFEAVKPERAALVERLEGGDLVCKAYRGDTAEEMTISRTIANTVIDKRVSVLTSDAQTDERFASGASIIGQGIQAVMAVPLWDSKEVIGLVYADSRLTSGLFNDGDLRLLTMLANIAAIQMQNAKLFREQVEKERFVKEAQAAADIQLRLLPREAPKIPGYAFEGYNKPCYECGGDYWDGLDVGSERKGIVLSDVAGKGMGAAMLMAVIQATLQAAVASGPEPKDLVDRLGLAINRSAPSNRYATLFYIDLDHSAHRLRYINAGHAPLPLLVRVSGEVQELDTGGMPLGLFPGYDYPVCELELGPGDFIFASSDGVTDLEDPEGEMFGEKRLKELLVSLAGSSVPEIRTKLDARLDEFAKNTQQPDDLTYIILQRSA